MRTLPLVLLTCLPACADGLGDLKGALGRLPGTGSVKGGLEVQTWQRRGEGKEAVDKHGRATAWVEDGQQGMRLQWGRTLLAQASAESRAQRKDLGSPAPVLTGLEQLGPKEVLEQVNAGEGLGHQLGQLAFKGEAREPYNGRNLRVLTFTVNLPPMPEKDRKTVKDFQGNARIWIEDDGQPVAASVKTTLKIRPIVMVNVLVDKEEQFAFGRVGDRLVCTRVEVKESVSGAGESNQSRTIRTFSPQ